MAALIPVQCPHCGAKVEVDPDLDRTTCRYCGITSWIDRPGAQRPKPPPNTRVIHLSGLPGWEGPPPATPLYPTRPTTPGSVRRPLLIIPLMGAVLAMLVGGMIAFGAMTVRKRPADPGSPAQKTVADIAAPALPPRRETRDFSRSGRPLIVDVDADGSEDAIVWESRAAKGPYVALDGKSGKTLWTSPPYTPPDGTPSFTYVADGVLIVVRGVELTLLDLAKGSALRTITLDDKAARPCRATVAGTTRVLFESDEVAVVDLKTGQLKLEKKGAACDEENSDFKARPDDLRRRVFNPRFLPARVDGMQCGGVAVHGTYNYHVEDPCGPKLGATEEELGFDPRAAAILDGGALVFGQKKRGRHVAMLGWVARRKLVWSAAISSADPAAQPEEGAERVALRGKQVALLSTAAGQARQADVLVVFDISTGKREREVALPAKGNFVASFGAGWLVVADKAMYRVSDGGQLSTFVE